MSRFTRESVHKINAAMEMLTAALEGCEALGGYDSYGAFVCSGRSEISCQSPAEVEEIARQFGEEPDIRKCGKFLEYTVRIGGVVYRAITEAEEAE